MSESDSYRSLTADAADRSLADDLRQLVSDAQTLAKAEAAYQKSRAAFAGQQAKGIAVLAVFGAVLVFFALMALTVGLVIALAPLLTAWGATGAVFAGLLVAAAICFLLALGRWRHMTGVLKDESE